MCVAETQVGLSACMCNACSSGYVYGGMYILLYFNFVFFFFFFFFTGMLVLLAVRK